MTRNVTRLARCLTSRSSLVRFTLLFLIAFPLIATSYSPSGPRSGGTAGQASACQDSQATAQQQLGSIGQSAPNLRAEPSSGVPAITVTDHRMTALEPANNCAPPTARNNFAPSDARAYQWTLVTGAIAGDTVRWDFRQPNGTTYFLSDPLTLTFGGGACFWNWINISGFQAASLLGTWEVRVLYNGVQVASDNFTIRDDSVVLTDHRTTGTDPAGEGCPTPPLKTAFLPTDERVYQWTLVSGAQVGDQVRWEFIQPNGSVYATSNTLTLSGGGNRCFWVSIQIAGQPAASLLGAWKVRVIYNNVPLLPEPGDAFTIAQSACPTVNNISPSGGSIASQVTITGTNFTGVTVVKFSNNVSASFTVVNNTTITTIVPSAAVGGPITISKPGCSDVQTSAFLVLIRPVIEVTPASLNFGNVLTGERGSQTLTLRNIGNAILDITSLTSNNSQFVVNLAAPAFSLFPNGTANIRVDFIPTSGGTKTGSLTINSNDSSRPVVNVSMTGNGLAPAIEVTPPSLSFGELRLAQSRDLSFLIRNTGTAPLIVSTISISNPRFAVTRFVEKPSNTLLDLPLIIAAGGSVEVFVRFRPSYFTTSVGPQSGVISLTTNDPVRVLVDVPVSGTGLGVIIIGAPSLSFGSAPVCTAPITLPYTFTNEGNLPMGVAQIVTENPAFSLAPRPPLPFSIQPGGSFTVNVTFYTRSPGVHLGKLKIATDAVNFPTLEVGLTGIGLPFPTPTIGQLSVSRTTLSHGRADNVRPVTPFNPVGLADVTGFAFFGGFLPANSIAPGVLPLPLLTTAIPSAVDPMRITLAGGAANPIVLSAANIPSCFTLVVAEGVTAPDVTRWDRIGLRFGAGNLYASVAIPGTSIFAGMELVTEADFNAYTANSIIHEAPDFGLLVAPAGQNGGTQTFQARARRIPTDTQCQPLLSPPASTQVEFSRTVRIEIDLTRTVIVRRLGGGLNVTITAQIFGNFDPAINTVVRWAFDGNQFDSIIDAPDPSAPGAPRLVTETFEAGPGDECNLAQITVVASSTGNLPAFLLPPINPFLLIPDSIGLFTFRSGGSTVEDTKTVLVKLPTSNCLGGAAVGWIHGRVTNQITGAPIAGATVAVVGQNISTTTREDGTYELNTVPAGPRTLEVTAPGFNTRQVQVDVVPDQVKTENVTLLPLNGTLRGYVLARDGLPIAGATVTVKGTTLSATTGGDGSYVITNVPVGPQTVDATAANFAPDQATVNIIGDQTVFEDFFLVPLTGTITGTVRNSVGSAPIASATVTAAGISTTSSGTGSFTLSNVPAGPQTLSATASGFNAASIGVTVVAASTVNQDIPVIPLTGTITGKIRNADNGDPVPGVAISLNGTSLATTSDADGNYTLSNVPAGPQNLSITQTNYIGTFPSVTVVGNETLLLNVSLTPLKGLVEGRISDSEDSLTTITNAQVQLLPFPLVLASTDSSGNYSMTNVPTGQQVFLATAPNYKPKVTVVDVKASPTLTRLDFELRREKGRIDGMVLDQQLKPVPNAIVQIVGTNNATISGPDGVYKFTEVRTGSVTLSASKNGFEQAQVTVTVFADKQTYQDIFLRTPTGGVRGTVRNAVNNAPIGDALILVAVFDDAAFISSRTDAGGNYTVSGIPAGLSITVSARHPAFNPQTQSVNIVANQTVTQDFALTPRSGSIDGSVRSSAPGNPPLEGVTVTVAGTSLSTTTSPTGSYQLLPVPAGPQTLSFSKTGFRSTQVQVTVVADQVLTQDVTLTLGGGTINGVVRNASDATPIVGAIISVAGTSLATTSIAGGAYTIVDVPPGAQTLNATATGFIATQVPVTVTDGQTVTQNISLSPTLPAGEIRITLNWAKNQAGHPHDLDAHLTGPNPDNTCFHVFYGNTGNLVAAPFAKLEVDNISISGAPPTETVRIGKLTPGIYRFYVINFRNEDQDGLSRSRATVQVFGSTGQLGSFTVPNGAGATWTVFELNGATGQVTAINQLASPAGNCR